ncbi:Holo-[acyl-carrier-protein] synthase [subsurface metagenome]
MQLIGTDIIEIDRIKRVLGRWGTRFLHRVYTDSELSQCRMRLPSLAVRFAGKEAALKMLGTQTGGISWKDVEILSDSTGKPLVNLHGKARLQADYLRLKNLAISLSHSREYALAVVIGEAKEG